MLHYLRRCVWFTLRDVRAPLGVFVELILQLFAHGQMSPTSPRAISATGHSDIAAKNANIARNGF
jgi:hypothetical protein